MSSDDASAPRRPAYLATRPLGGPRHAGSDATIINCYLQENDLLMECIRECQNRRRLGEADHYADRLYQNIMYLSAIADGCLPPPSTESRDTLFRNIKSVGVDSSVGTNIASNDGRKSEESDAGRALIELASPDRRPDVVRRPTKKQSRVGL